MIYIQKFLENKLETEIPRKLLETKKNSVMWLDTNINMKTLKIVIKVN